MNLEEIKKFLEENKETDEVKTFLGELKHPTKEDVEGYLESEEGKKLLQPKLDKNFSTGLETWKSNNLESLIDEKVKELYPEQTPEQQEIAKLKQQFEQSQRAQQREELKNKALTIANEKGIPTNLIDYLIGEDEESTVSNLEKFQEESSQYVQKQVEKRLKSNEYKPPSGDAGDLSTGSRFAEQANKQAEPVKNTIWD